MENQEESVKTAIRVILSDKKAYKTTLNYAVNYAKAALEMNMEGEELKIQVIYILSNITYWRHPKAKEVRAILRKFKN